MYSIDKSLFIINKFIDMKDIFKGKNTVYNFILNSGNLKGYFIDCTEIVNTYREKHNLGIMETYIAGNAALAATLKNNEKIKTKFECSGPVKGFSIEADTNGETRGYLFANPIPMKKIPESFDTSDLFQAGFITVTRYSPDKKPFSGQVMIEHGNIASDLANYYLVSEQIKTAFNLSVKFNTEGNVTGAGGLFLQAMPGASEEEIETAENIINSLPSIGNYLTESTDSISFLMEHFRISDIQILETRPAEFKCRCSKERFGGFLSSLPEKEIDKILHDDIFPLKLTCYNCSSEYDFSKEEILDIQKTLKPGDDDPDPGSGT